MAKTIHIKSKYLNDEAHLVWGQYENGTPRLALFSDVGEPLSVPTVALPGASPRPGHIFVRTYSQGAGMVEGMIEAGVIEKPVRWLRAGYEVNGIAECPLTPDYAAEVQEMLEVYNGERAWQ